MLLLKTDKKRITDIQQRIEVKLGAITKRDVHTTKDISYYTTGPNEGIIYKLKYEIDLRYAEPSTIEIFKAINQLIKELKVKYPEYTVKMVSWGNYPKPTKTQKSINFFALSFDLQKKYR